MSTPKFRPITPENDPAFFRTLGTLTDMVNEAREGGGPTRKQMAVRMWRALYPGKTDEECWADIRAEFAKRGKELPE